MKNMLLNSLGNACRAYGHIVYNSRLNNGTGGFERAGKRHAIASFFGTAGAKAKNQMTLTKIKELLSAEVANGGRFYGSTTDIDGLFASVDGNKRICSKTVGAIVRDFRQSAKSDPEVLRAHKADFVKELLKNESSGVLSRKSMAELVGVERLSERLTGDATKGEWGKIIGIVAEHLLNRELSGLTVEESIWRLHDGSFKSHLTSCVVTGLKGFLEAIRSSYKNDDETSTKEAGEAFAALLEVSNIKEDDRHNLLVASGLCWILDRWLEDGSRNFDLHGEFCKLSARLGNKSLGMSVNLALHSPNEMIRRLTRIGSLEFTLEQLKDLMTLSWDEMDRLNGIIGFELDGGAAVEDVYAQMFTVDSPLKRLHAYPELVADATTYRRAKELLEAFDGRIDALISTGELKKFKASAKWMLERFVFQDLAVKAGGESGLPDVQSFADGLSMENIFVRLAERTIDNGVIPWTILSLPPEFRIPVMTALEVYDDYKCPYLLTRLIVKVEKVVEMYNEAIAKETAITQEQIFHLISGDEASFDPSIHGKSEYWRDLPVNRCNQILEEKGITFRDGIKRSLCKSSMLNDFILRYAFSDEDLKGVAFRDFKTTEEAVRYTEFRPVDALLVLNGIDKGIKGAVEQFARDFRRYSIGRIKIWFDDFGNGVCFTKENNLDEQVQSVVDDVSRTVIRMCGTSHPQQAENLLMVLSQALESELYAAFAAFECNPLDNDGGVSKSFEIVRNGKDGSIQVHVTDMGNSALMYDWNITIYPDGSHKASDMKCYPHPTISAPWPEHDILLD